MKIRPVKTLILRLAVLLLALAAYYPFHTTVWQLTPSVNGEERALRLSPHKTSPATHAAIQCYGTRKESKSCLVRNAWFHVPSSTFTLPGFTDVELELFGLENLHPFKFSVLPTANVTQVIYIQNHTLLWEFVDSGAEYSPFLIAQDVSSLPHTTTKEFHGGGRSLGTMIESKTRCCYSFPFVSGFIRPHHKYALKGSYSRYLAHLASTNVYSHGLSAHPSWCGCEPRDARPGEGR